MSDDSPGPGHADEIRRLLIGYTAALDTAEELSPLVRIAIRPRRWALCEPFRRLPRSTVGTHSMVVYHARRSIADLERRYARIAATRGLTDDEELASQLVSSFRQSLPALRWKLIVAGGLVGLFVTVQLVVGGIANLLTRAARTPGQDPTSERVRALAESLIRAGSSAPTANSFIDLFGQFGKAGLVELLALAATLTAAAYVIIRPLSPAFRMKRLIFNLMPAGPVDVHRTTSTWHVPRSVGLYDLERHAFRRVGGRPPREIDLDLWTSVVPPAAVVLLLVTGDFGELLRDPTLLHFLVVVCVGPVVARIVWLIHTGLARRRTVRPVDPPAGLTVPSGDIVEVRSVSETAGFGLVTSYFLSPTMLVPSPIWIRLVRERRAIEQAPRPPEAAAAKPARWLSWPAVGSAMLLWLLPVVPVAIHLIHLMRLQPKEIHSARRKCAWLVPLAAATTAFVLFDFGYRAPAVGETWVPIFPSASAVFSAIAFAAIQREHNTLFARVGTPLPFDEPVPSVDRIHHPAPLPTLATAAYTSWHTRVLAFLIDVVPLALLAAAGAGFAWTTGKQICEAPDGCSFVVSGTASTVLLVTAALMLLYAIWNWGIRQGATGASVGKALLKFEVLSEKTGRPVGIEWSVVRQLAHLADCATLLVGWLMPLWDGKRQTLADKIMSTVCLSVGATRASPPSDTGAHAPELVENPSAPVARR